MCFYGACRMVRREMLVQKEGRKESKYYEAIPQNYRLFL